MRVHGIPEPGSVQGADLADLAACVRRARLLPARTVADEVRRFEAARTSGFARSLAAWFHDRRLLDLVELEALVAAGSKAARPLLPGLRLAKLIRWGGTAAVYRARWLARGETVALKVRLASDADPDGRHFKEEGGAAMRLVHPNIVRVHDVGWTPDFDYLICELVRGDALDSLLGRRGRLPERRLISIGLQVAAALAHAHGRAILHGDVKAGNVLLGPAGRARLCDFSPVRVASGTRGLARFGSPMSMAPEYLASGHLDARSDVYGLGVLLYAGATGLWPFPGDSPAEVMENAVRLTPLCPRALVPEISRGLASTITRAMAKDPRDRFPSATHLLRRLRRLARA